MPQGALEPALNATQPRRPREVIANRFTGVQVHVISLKSLGRRLAHTLLLLLTAPLDSFTNPHQIPPPHPARFFIMPFWEKGASEKEYASHSPDGHDGHDGHDIVNIQDGEIAENADMLQRRLSNRQIQLIAIGGSIGTALFVSIGGGLHYGGPGSLFIAYTIYACMLALVNNCIAEMTTHYPVSGGFIRLAGHFVDDALGTMAGWNFFIYEALLIPFEITALTLVLGFWSENIPGWAIPVACIVSSSAHAAPRITLS